MPKSDSNTSETAGKASAKTRFAELMHRFNGGGWFSFCLDFCYVLDDSEAVFVQRLINLYCMAHPTDVDGDGYFRCSVAYLNYPPLSWTARRQRRLIEKLTTKQRAKKPYVSTKVVGNDPPQRWVRVEIENIERDIEAVRKTQGRTGRKKWE